MKRVLAFVLVVAGVATWFFPQWSGALLPYTGITESEGRLMAVVLVIGGLMFLLLRQNRPTDDER